jgi:hypothetical protein
LTLEAVVPYIQNILPLQEAMKDENMEKFMLDVVTLMQNTFGAEFRVCSPPHLC